MEHTYEQELTALLVVDPYNDFISAGGKLWPQAQEIAEAVNCVPNMKRVLEAARSAGLSVFFVPHHRWRPGDYESWRYIAPIQANANRQRLFEAGTWGGEFHPEFEPQAGEIVTQEHWCSSGFANTDLDLHLKKKGLHKLIVIGLRANTCIEATVRFAAELGYEVTVVKDAIAAYSWEQMNVALELNLPSYASSIVSTSDLLPHLRVVQLPMAAVQVK